MRSNSLKDDFRALVSNGNSLNQLMMANIAVYIGLSLVAVLLALFNLKPGWYHLVSGYLAVPAYVPNLMYRPWSPVTYMFVHGGFFHILFNMLWLFWIGRIFQEFLGNKKLVGLYFLGGFAGALFYIVSFNLFPLFSNVLTSAKAVGASASVLAIVVATATLLPNYTLRLFLFGNVPLKYLALFMVVIDLLSLAGNNAGGHFAHLGGAIFGFVYIKQLQAGRDLTAGFNRLLDALVSRFGGGSKLKVSYKRPAGQGASIRTQPARTADRVPQEVIDRILDKIAQNGYDGLSKEEKEQLFKASKQ